MSYMEEIEAVEFRLWTSSPAEALDTLHLRMLEAGHLLRALHEILDSPNCCAGSHRAAVRGVLALLVAAGRSLDVLDQFTKAHSSPAPIPPTQAPGAPFTSDRACHG